MYYNVAYKCLVGISNINSDAILFMLIDAVCDGKKDTHVCPLSIKNPHRTRWPVLRSDGRDDCHTPTQHTDTYRKTFLNRIIYHFTTISISMQNLSTHTIMNKQLTKNTNGD